MGCGGSARQTKKTEIIKRPQFDLILEQFIPIAGIRRHVFEFLSELDLMFWRPLGVLLPNGMLLHHGALAKPRPFAYIGNELQRNHKNNGKIRELKDYAPQRLEYCCAHHENEFMQPDFPATFTVSILDLVFDSDDLDFYVCTTDDLLPTPSQSKIRLIDMDTRECIEPDLKGSNLQNDNHEYYCNKEVQRLVLSIRLLQRPKFYRVFHFAGAQCLCYRHFMAFDSNCDFNGIVYHEYRDIAAEHGTSAVCVRTNAGARRNNSAALKEHLR